MLLDRHKARDARRESEESLGVEGLREARVDDRRLDTVGRERLRRGERRVHRMAVREQHDVVALAQRLRRAERDLLERLVGARADARPAREAHGDAPAARGRVTVRGPEHVPQHPLVARRHQGHARHRPQVCDVVQALMRAAVVADDARAIEREHDREVLHRDVMEDLVVRALQERRVDRDDRHDALRREAAGHRHRVLFGDADVDQPPGELPEERLQAGAARHRRGDRDGALVVPEDLAHCVREDRGVLRRARLRRACRGDAVPLHVVVLGGPVAVAFLRVEMHEDRPVAEVARLLEQMLHGEEVVAVDRSEVREAELLEEQVRDQEGLHRVEDAAARFLDEVRPGHMVEDVAHDVLRLAVRRRRADRLEHARNRADIRRDAHAVVVQHDDDAAAVVADVVQPLEREARGERAVADDGDDVEVLTLEVARDGHAVRCGDARAGVTRAEDVVLRLAAREEAADAAELPQRVEALAAPGEDLVHVRLMAGVPDELVARRIEDAVQRDGELDRPEAGRDVTARLLDGLDGELADLAAELEQLVLGERAKIARLADPGKYAHSVFILRARDRLLFARGDGHGRDRQPRTLGRARVAGARRTRRRTGA